ncbi:MAG: SAVED domain-containing protein [Thermoguttaceae bacterium]|nr:SAVED domain-containing protein [Thermoguttaceae bacterium]MDW8078472.1 SAVED domain-containing protein [Thermoguttaceae bacterium]
MWDSILKALAFIWDVAIRFSVPFFMAWGIQETRIYFIRRKLKRLMAEQGQREVALIISNRHEIRADVEAYLRSCNKPHMPIFEFHRPEVFAPDSADWQDFVGQVRRKVLEMRRYAPTRILLFTNVPVAMGVFLGALLDNGPQVVVHHFFNGLYRPVGFLSQETVGFDPAALESLSDATVDAVTEPRPTLELPPPVEPTEATGNATGSH